MNQEEMKLPMVESQSILSEKFWRREWVIDEIFLRKIKPEILTQMGKLRLHHLAECARMEADVKHKEAEMFEQMSKLRM